MEKITPSDIQEYCENGAGTFLAHGTTTSTIDDIIKEGLLARAKDFPTVLFANGGYLGDSNEQKVIDYTWYEPRSQGESVVLILEVPNNVVEKIRNNGLPVCQKTIFDEICEDIELEVPDTPETREAFIRYQNKQNIEDGLGDITIGLYGPKFSKYGAKPGTKYTHVGVPPKYICAITSKDNVYYANKSVVEFAKNKAQKGNNVQIKEEQEKEQQVKPSEIENLTLYEADKYF